jgi:hypothetical protein
MKAVGAWHPSPFRKKIRVPYLEALRALLLSPVFDSRLSLMHKKKKNDVIETLEKKKQNSAAKHAAPTG